MKITRVAYLLFLIAGIAVLSLGCRIEILPGDFKKQITQEIDSGDYTAALADLDKLERFAGLGDMAWVYGERGYVYMKQRKYEAAVEELNRAIAVDSKKAAYYNNRGFSYEMLVKLSEAESDYSAAIALEPQKARRYTERSAFYFNAGKLTESMSDTEHAIALDPQDPENYLRRADTRIRLKQFDRHQDAIADLRKVMELQPSGSLRDAAELRLRALGIQP